MPTKSRIILYTGKGGVGKTTVAAATALLSSDLGYKTIVLSTDIAHSLADSFGLPLCGEPRKITRNLYGQEIDFLKEKDRQWKIIEEWYTKMETWREKRWGREDILASEVGFLSGVEEAASLLNILKHYEGSNYQVIIVDCAPSGQTLHLLSFPERMFCPYMRKSSSGVWKFLVKMAIPFMERVSDFPVPKEEVLESMQSFFTRIKAIHHILTDPERTSVRMIVNPEEMVIKETQRTFTYLNLYGYPTDLIVYNRLIPDEVKDPYFDFWKEGQKKYYQLIEERFAPLPILNAPLMREEVVGTERLRKLAQAIFFGKDDPTKIYFRGKPIEIKRDEGYYILTIALPFVSRKELSLARADDELLIELKNHRRNLILPSQLVRLEIERAEFKEKRLSIRFKRREPGISG